MAAVSWSLLFLSLSLLSLPPTTTSEPTYAYNICDNATTFATNSQYHTNLNTVLHSLSSNATTPGSSLFFATSAGATTPDSVYGLFLCRGDQNATACHDCVTMATTTDLPTIYCPNRKISVIFYDQCMVRYSNSSILGKLDQNSGVTLMNAQNINGNSTLFNLLLVDTMNELTAEAAAGDKSGKKFAVKEANFTTVENLYALAQCTPDLSSGDCSKCLKAETTKLLVKKMGAQVLQPSCIARYETYPFYNGAPPAISEVAGDGGRSGKKKLSGKVIAAIVVPVVVVSLAMLVIGVCCITKKVKKHDAVAFSHGEDFTTIESLQYDLATLQSATNNFSNEDKLGEGGFGGVYKIKWLLKGDKKGSYSKYCFLSKHQILRKKGAHWQSLVSGKTIRWARDCGEETVSKLRARCTRIQE